MKFVPGIIALAFILCALAQTDGNNVAYPAGYRRWSHVKSTVIGPQHPRYESNGGMHHFYANDKAIEGYHIGKFPDGAVLVDDLFEVIDKGGGSRKGLRTRTVCGIFLRLVLEDNLPALTWPECRWEASLP